MANFRAEFCEISKAIGLKNVHLRFYSGFGEIRKVKYLSDFRNTTQIKTNYRVKFPKPALYRIACKCGVVYIGDTGRNLSLRFKEHKTNCERAELEKSAVAKHSWTDDIRIR